MVLIGCNLITTQGLSCYLEENWESSWNLRAVRSKKESYLDLENCQSKGRALLVMLVSAPSALFIQACFLYFFKADLPSCHGTHLNVTHTNGQKRKKWRKSNVWWLNHITHHFSYPSLTQPTIDIIQWLTVSEPGWQNSLFIPSFAPIGTKWWLCIYPRHCVSIQGRKKQGEAAQTIYMLTARH